MMFVCRTAKSKKGNENSDEGHCVKKMCMPVRWISKRKLDTPRKNNKMVVGKYLNTCSRGVSVYGRKRIQEGEA